MDSYYFNKLSAERLKLCYEAATPRIKQYLEAEIAFVLDKIESSHLVLELGCGYGRVLQRLVGKANTVVGIDTSYTSLCHAKEIIGGTNGGYILMMDAVELGFRNRQFDVVICIQNGISAFNVDQRKLIEEAMKVTRSGGTVLFSSYSERFWEDRFEWFRIQSDQGLIGEIDENATGNGVIVCKDGFRAGMVSPHDFAQLTLDFDVNPIISEVDGSSVFYELRIL